MNGFWTVVFGSSTGMFGGGVLWFHEGKITGGDAGYYYSGSIEQTESTFTASLNIIPFIPDYVSVFNTQGQSLVLDLVGTIVGDQAIAQGQIRGMPGLRFSAKLTHRGKFPY